MVNAMVASSSSVGGLGTLQMMYYFLVMEVWQSAYAIFLGQGKYAMDILKRFGMLDCKMIATSMTSNLNLLCDDSSETQ